MLFRSSGAYRGIAGVYASPYGIYWLKVLGTRPDNRIIVQNLFDRGDEKIDPVQVAIEPDLVYPAVAGRNITRYGVKDFFYVLVTQDLDTRRGIDEDGMLTDYPLTYAYLSQFRDILVSRAAYKKYFHAEIGPQGRKRTVATAPFYSIYNTSRLSVAPHRVTWKRMASRLDAVVLSQVLTPFGPKPMVSTDTTAFIPTDDAREAHYLCALLNSAVVGAFVRSF